MVNLRNAIVRYCYKFLCAVMRCFKFFHPKYVIFESKPTRTDNSYAVYNYIKENNLLKNYILIWSEKETTLVKKILLLYYMMRAKAVVFCNEMFEKSRNDQITIHLCHGSKSKKTRGKYEAPKDLDYILVQSDVFEDSLKYEYNLSEYTKMITLGYPRNDDLLLKNNFDRNELFADDFKKLIVWYPTFRQHKCGGKSVSSIALPIIHNEKSAKILNEYARENDVLIVLKPHFAQDVSYIKDNKLSNITIIDDDFLKHKNLRSYQLLSLSDALITDYSSVYYDYLLTDKPIGLVWEDYEEYKKNQGFALNPDLVYQGGEKIYSVDDFCVFIKRISNGEDILREERKQIKNITNVYQDAQSSKRVSEFICNLLR